MDNGSLTGAYVIYNLQSSFGGTDPNGGWGVSDSAGLSQVEVTFDGSGGWSGSSTDYQLERQTGEISKDMGINPDVDLVLSNRFTVLAPAPETGGVSGSYTVNSDGTGTITHGEGTDQIFVSPDGSIFLIGSRNYSGGSYAWLSMGIGLKKTSTPKGMPWLPLILE
jgi:hypothetical protein